MTLNSTSRRTSETAAEQEKIVHGTNLRITVAANQGGRKYMEDRVQIESFRNPEDGSILFTYLGVYDGHGGYEASEFVRQNLMKNIIDNDLFDSDDDKDVREAIRQGFLETHDQIRSVADAWPKTASGFASTAGTTASVAILKNGKLYSGHIGDSAIVLCRRTKGGSVSAIRVTIDHKPESEAEQDRIYQAGGQVMAKSGVHRVVWTRPLRGHVGPVRRSMPMENIPFLAVARSLGDLWSYCEATKTFIVSPEPDIEIIELTGDDYCIVLASDGLTNVLHPSQVPTIIDEEENSNNDDGSSVLAKNPLKQINHSRKLLSAALKNWRNFRADNISAVCVYLDNPSEQSWITERSLEQKLQINQSIDEMFCIDPECMIRVAPDRTHKLATYRTPLIYLGTVDANFTSVDYRGPGFITHDEEVDPEMNFANKVLQDLVKDNFDLLPSVDNSSSVLDPLLDSPRSRCDKRSADSNIVEGPSSGTPTKKGRCTNKESNGSDEENPDLKTPTSTRITRSRTVEMKKIQSEPRQKAVAVRKSSRSPPSLSVVNKEVFSSPAMLQISVNDSETESTGVVTRSRDRQTTLLVSLSPAACSSTPLAAFQTPGAMIAEKSSRKRPRNAFSGATPFVERLSFDSPAGVRISTPKMRSAPSTPAKEELSALVGSTWSLSKIESLRGATSDNEPPSKMRKVIGFMKRLVGFGNSDV